MKTIATTGSQKRIIGELAEKLDQVTMTAFLIWAETATEEKAAGASTTEAARVATQKAAALLLSVPGYESQAQAILDSLDA